jgi:hypothetical protein
LANFLTIFKILEKYRAKKEDSIFKQPIEKVMLSCDYPEFISVKHFIPVLNLSFAFHPINHHDQQGHRNYMRHLYRPQLSEGGDWFLPKFSKS